MWRPASCWCMLQDLRVASGWFRVKPWPRFPKSMTRCKCPNSSGPREKPSGRPGEAPIPGSRDLVLAGACCWRFPCAALLGWVLVQALWLPRYFWSRYRNHQSVPIDWKTTSKPLWLLLSTMIHRFLWVISAFRCCPGTTTFVQREWWSSSRFSWLLLQMMQQLMWRGRQRAILSGRMGTSSLASVGRAHSQSGDCGDGASSDSSGPLAST